MKKFLLVASALLFTSPAFISPAFAATKTADFALGCFWCAEHDFTGIPGVLDVVSGYEGGTKETATYEQVSRGTTGHHETVRVTYDDTKVSYEELLNHFWDNVDPFDAEGQFCDKGKQYTAIIFANGKSEQASAESSLKALQSRHPDEKVAVQVLPAKEFYKAEDYHQDYAENNQVKYNLYRTGCGRDGRLKDLKQK